MKRVWKDGYSYTEPPEYDEPEYIDREERVVIPLDAIIIMHSDGSWDYQDETYSWARNGDDDYWESSSDEYPAIKLCDTIDAVELTDTLLEPLLPFAEGRYRIKGQVNLVFQIDNIHKYTDYLGSGYDDEDVVEEEYITDYAIKTFLYNESSIEDFEIEKLG